VIKDQLVLACSRAVYELKCKSPLGMVKIQTKVLLIKQMHLTVSDKLPLNKLHRHNATEGVSDSFYAPHENIDAWGVCGVGVLDVIVWREMQQ